MRIPGTFVFLITPALQITIRRCFFLFSRKKPVVRASRSLDFQKKDSNCNEEQTAEACGIILVNS